MSIAGGIDGEGFPFLDSDVTTVPTLFRTPTRPNPRHTVNSTGAQQGLFRHFTVAPVGVAVLRIGSTFTESPLPTHAELEAADAYWMGGRDHTVTQAEASALADAGYGANLVGDVQVTTGIDSDGFPYEDTDGADDGEQATATIEDGDPVFTREEDS